MSRLCTKILTHILQMYVKDAVAFSTSPDMREQDPRSCTQKYHGGIPGGFVSCWFPKKSNDGWCGQCSKCEEILPDVHWSGVEPPFEEWEGKDNYVQMLTPDLFTNRKRWSTTRTVMYMPTELIPTIRSGVQYHWYQMLCRIEYPESSTTIRSLY